MKNKIIWLFATNYGRYLLGILLSITGVFSQYSTIGFLSTDYVIFEYTSALGILIIVLQFIYHAVMAIILNSINDKK